MGSPTRAFARSWLIVPVTYGWGLREELRDSTRERLRQEKIWAIYEDVDGGMWFGTRGRGLFLLREGKISNYSTAQGFPSNNIFSIMEDDHAALWMSSSTGVFSVDRKNLENSARNEHSKTHI